MNYRSAWMKPAGIFLIVLLLSAAAPHSPAGTAASAPLGSIISAGDTIVGNTTAPTGTTIFAGDTVTAVDATLLSLSRDSRIEMTKATANFDRKGDALIVKVDEGLLRFNFSSGQNVEIEAGDYRFTATGNSGAVGEFGMNRRGQMAVNLVNGSFQALNTATGTQTSISVATPFMVMDMTGKGRIVKEGNTVNDEFMSLETDSLLGQCIVAGSEAYAISGNEDGKIVINGNWQLNTGEYTYQVVECTVEAMVQVGATREAARNAEIASVFGVQPVAQKSHTARNVAILAGIGGGVAVPVAIKAMGKEDKSPSSR